MKKKIKNALFSGVLVAGLYVANSLSPKIICANQILNEEEQKEITLFMHPEKYKCSFTGSEEERALSYLKLAHIITMNNIELTEDTNNLPFKLKDRLATRRGDCGEFTQYTYANFLYLINAKKEEQLTQKVRMSLGFFKYINKKKVPHGWIEIKQKNRWVPYETTCTDINDGVIPPNTDSLVLEKIIDLVFEKVDPITQNPSFYISEFTTQILPDKKRKNSYNIPECLKDYKGYTGLLIKTWNSHD